MQPLPRMKRSFFRRIDSWVGNEVDEVLAEADAVADNLVHPKEDVRVVRTGRFEDVDMPEWAVQRKRVGQDIAEFIVGKLRLFACDVFPHVEVGVQREASSSYIEHAAEAEVAHELGCDVFNGSFDADVTLDFEQGVDDGRVDALGGIVYDVVAQHQLDRF